MSNFPTKPQPPIGFGPPPVHPVEVRRSQWLGGCLAGCGITLILSAVVAAVGMYLLVTEGPKLAANLARTALKESIDQFESLNQVDRETIKQQIDRIVDAFRAGTITAEQLTDAFEDISESPVIGAVVLLAIKAQFLDESELTAEEKKEAERTVQRVWRGRLQGQISQNEINAAFELVASKSQEDEGEWNLRDDVSDEELRSFFGKLKGTADDAGVADEDYQVSIGEEVRKIVDKLLGESENSDAESEKDPGPFED